MNEELIEAVEFETVDEINVEMSEAVGWTGGDSTRHDSLYGREEANQHPITSITGLREELDDIEALDVVFSNKKNQADYYLWEDENPSQDVRTGLFVTLCNDTSKIRICGLEDDIFGVTVASAAFVGGQDDVVRDAKYGLVVYSGVAAVRCYDGVVAGDYVVPRVDGRAKKAENGYGYKVFALANLDGVMHAIISLGISGNKIHALASGLNALENRVADELSPNVTAAMNMANEAYNKAVASNGGSDEAIGKANEAVDNANSAVKEVGNLGTRVDAINELATQAQTIAANAALSAETMRAEAVDAANAALEKAGEIEAAVKPISSWEYTDPVTGETNTGATYFAEYVKNGLSTKAEMETVNTLDEENKLLIEKNAESYRQVILSLDKYSVGEYSQSYGLTYEQAKTILKVGIIYVPTNSHSETFEDTGKINPFTPGDYYVWDGNVWSEMQNTVAFFSERPNPGTNLRYWYIDSDNAPDGYEPYALYMWDSNKWQKVNIFCNNHGNRMVSSISQEVDNIALEITNARGSYAGLSARLKADNEAQTAMIAKVVDTNGDVNAASIIAAINDAESSVNIEADHIVLNGYNITNGNGSFQIDDDGNMIANGGYIGGWTIAKKDPDGNTYTGGIYSDKQSGEDTYRIGLKTEECYPSDAAIYVTKNPLKTNANGQFAGTNIFYVQHDGKLYAQNAEIEGKITASTGSNIGGWTIAPQQPKTGTSYNSGIYRDCVIGNDIYRVGMKIPVEGEEKPGSIGAFYVTKNPLGVNANNVTATSENMFYVQNDGKLFAKEGSFSRDVTIAGRKISDWMDDKGNVTHIEATGGSVGGWKIGNNLLQSPDYGTSLFSNGQFIFAPNSTDAYVYVSFTHNVVTDKYNFGLGQNTIFQFGNTTFTSEDFAKLKELIK